MIATESHRPSSWSEAVKEWNERHKDDGYKSSYAPQMPCPSCKAEGQILSTIHGVTTATCKCGHSWVLA